MKDSQFYRDISVTEGCVRCGEGREDIMSVTRKNKFLSEYCGGLHVEQFRYSKRPVQEKRRVDSEVIGETVRLYDTVDGWICAPCLVNSSTVLLPEKNE